MSSTRVNNKRTFSKFSQPEEKKFCGTCQKAGKSEKEYTSHFTKSVPGPKGIIVCPTILSAECSFCHQKGHWASEEFCPALKAKKRMQNNATTTNTNKKQEADVEKPIEKKYGSYEVFNQPEPQKPKEEFPALGNPIKSKAVTTMNYASMVKKETPIYIEEPSEFTTFSVLNFENTKVSSESKIFHEAVNKGRVGNFETLIDTFDDDYDNDDNYDEDDDDDEDEEYCKAWYNSRAKSSF